MDSEKLLEKYKNKATESDVGAIDRKIRKMNRGRIKSIWSEVVLLYKMVKDERTPWHTRIIAVSSLLYLVSTIDAIPDFIPFVGFLDDIGVILFTVKHLSGQLQKYKNDVDYFKDDLGVIKEHSSGIISKLKNYFSKK